METRLKEPEKGAEPTTAGALANASHSGVYKHDKKPDPQIDITQDLDRHPRTVI
jgi:hypothetical protein